MFLFLFELETRLILKANNSKDDNDIVYLCR